MFLLVALMLSRSSTVSLGSVVRNQTKARGFLSRREFMKLQFYAAVIGCKAFQVVRKRLRKKEKMPKRHAAILERNAVKRGMKFLVLP